MPKYAANPEPVQRIKTLPDLISYLRDELGWPIFPDTVADDLTFDWSGDELRLAAGHGARLKDGVVRQLRPFVPGQPWGIFLVEFADTRVYRTFLRQILLGLVPSRRRDPSLQSWQQENLLFICATADYERFTFAHFKGDQVHRAKLATFGWRKGSAYLRTLIEHNLPYLGWPKDDGADPKAWQSEWARAFDKEPVTKKFFADFNNTFRKVCNDIANRHSLWPKETVEREAQTLLNRLLFLYFIQRKGWLNRDRQYLVNQFRKHYRKDPTGNSFLKDFLQPHFVKLSTKGPQADIQARAIEICKLRLWLSLVVDYPLDVDVDTCEKQSFRDNLKRLPALPNLDFKIRRANSLIDTIHGEPVPLGKLHASDQARVVLNKLTTAKREFYRADSVPDKRKLRFAIYAAMAELAQIELTVARNELGLLPDPENAGKVAELDQGQKAMAKVLGQIRDARKMKAADQDEALERIREFFDDEKRPTFVWQLDFAEVFHREKNPGFDLIIGNPPYVRIQVLNQVDPDQVAFFKEHYYSASKGNYDLYVVFVEHGLQLLQPQGQLAFILPHKFLNSQYGQPLCELISQSKHLRHVVHFGDQQVFPGATNYVCLLFLAKAAVGECRWVRVDDLPAWLETQSAQEVGIASGRLTSAEWNFAVGRNAGVFQKLQAMPLKLGRIAERISQGIRTSANEVYVLDARAERKGMVTAYSKQLDREVTLEREAVLQFLQGREIKAYSISPSGKVVVLPYKVQNHQMVLISSEDYRSVYPKAWEYLTTNKTYLREREGGRMRHEGWYGFIYPKNLEVMLAPKILVPDIADRAAFALDEEGQFAFTSGYGITLARDVEISPKYLLALLNSYLLDYCWKRLSTPLRGGFFRYFTQFIEQLPIHPINFADPGDRTEHDALVALVDRILKAKRADGAADTVALEREIDERVYRLYGLTAEEIKIVEEGSR
jgi:hypothetical protein